MPIVSTSEAFPVCKSLIVSLSGSTPPISSPDDFTVTIDTTKTSTGGTDSNSIGLFFSGSFNIQVFWGDNTTTTHTGSGTRVDHTYSSPGIYTVNVKDLGSSGFNFNLLNNNARDRLKFLSLSKWKGYRHFTGNNACFQGATNFQTINATDTPLFAQTNLVNMFNSSGLKTINNFLDWDFSTITNVQSMFQSTTTNFTETPGPPINSSSITTFTSCFAGSNNAANHITFESCTPINMSTMYDGAGAIIRGDVINWLLSNDYSNITNMTNMFRNASLTTEGYDLLIQKLDADGATNVTANFGTSVLTLGGAAEAAYDSLVSKGWIITPPKS